MKTYTTYPDQFIEIQGIQTRYWKTGNGDKTIVLLHGFAGSVLEWVYTIPPLQDTYTVIALDLPGHGRTGKPRINYDYDFFSAFLNDFFVAMGISEAVLIGHSMGGLIALHFTTKFSEKVRRLVLIAPAFGKKFHFFLHLMTLPAIGEFLLRPPSTRTLIRNAFKVLTYKPFDYDKNCLDSYYEFQHYPGYTQAMLTYLRGVVNVFGLTLKGRNYARWFDEELPKLKQPVLLVWGRQDKILAFKNAEPLRKLLSNVDLWEINECGHCPHFEYIEEFNRRVAEFLMGKCPGASRES